MAGTNISNIVPYDLNVKLTTKQRKWLESYFNCLDATQASKDAKYNCKNGDSYGVIGSQNFVKLKNHIAQWIDEVGMSDEAIKTKIIKGLSVKETKLNVIDKEVVETEVPARGIQQKYLDMAAKVKGLYAAVEVKGSVTLLSPERVKKDIPEI